MASGAYRQLPDLLPGVREGLHRLHDSGLLIVTEGAKRRVARTAGDHGFTGFFDRIAEAPKSERLFQRVQKLRRVRIPAFMARHMWNGPRCKGFFSRFHHAGTVRSYVRPLSAAHDRWPR